MKKAFFIFLITAFVTFPASALKDLAQVFEFDYKKTNMTYMYSGSKATVKYNGLPYDVDMVQISSMKSPGQPKLRILGKRNIPVNSQGKGNFFEFNIELTQMPKANFTRNSFTIEIRSFRKVKIDGSETYEDVEKAYLYVRPMTCPDEEHTVCALVQTPCRKYDRSCTGSKEEKITFANECEMNKHGGTYLYEGSCLLDS